MSEGALLPDKRRVAKSFSRAAASYDGVAELQRQVGGELLAELPSLAPMRWLDLGSGTGHFTRALNERYPQAEGMALDLAEGMSLPLSVVWAAIRNWVDQGLG